MLWGIFTFWKCVHEQGKAKHLKDKEVVSWYILSDLLKIYIYSKVCKKKSQYSEKD